MYSAVKIKLKLNKHQQQGKYISREQDEGVGFGKVISNLIFNAQSTRTKLERYKNESMRRGGRGGGGRERGGGQSERGSPELPIRGGLNIWCPWQPGLYTSRTRTLSDNLCTSSQSRQPTDRPREG